MRDLDGDKLRKLEVVLSVDGLAGRRGRADRRPARHSGWRAVRKAGPEPAAAEEGEDVRSHHGADGSTRDLKPLMLVVEDMHWADPDTLELFDRVVREVPNLPVLLIVAYRSDFAPPWIGQANTTLIALSRLNRRDATQLANQVMTGHDVRAMLIDRIVTQSDGVPLFIEELTRSVVENVENIATGRSLPPVPETLQALLTARLDRLPAAKRVAQAGATIRREFSRTLLAAILPISDEQLAAGLDELVASGLASRRGELSEIVYTFKHALVQEAIYNSLLRRRRAEIHSRIVSASESDMSLGIGEPGFSRLSLCAGRSAGEGHILLSNRGAAVPPNVPRLRRRGIYLERGLQIAEHLTEEPIATVWRQSC